MTTYVRCTDVLWRFGCDSVVLLPRASEDPFGVSDSGVLVWQLLSTPQTATAASTAVAAAYGVDERTASDSVNALLDTLVSRGAVVRVDA